MLLVIPAKAGIHLALTMLVNICLRKPISNPHINPNWHHRGFHVARDLLTSLKVFTLGGQDFATKSADNFRLLRNRGVTVRKTIDVLIATFCIERKVTLLHSNKDFEPFHEYMKLQNAMTSFKPKDTL